ncbi:hypothetical protein HK103_005720 [Boothiomyces macroporosus]|uniref:SUN domain-containing protein n=1 Tax=Boothiomyces macroporosus TaxID=261099 RepID=A0AAD5UEW1_9FUNG|nr:hypothetical protein HK103_005720 [Boothiomyces macroporosus]
MESPRVLRERKVLNYATTPFKKPSRPGKSRKDPFIASLEDSPAIHFLPNPKLAQPNRRNIFEDTNIPDDEEEEQPEEEPFYIIDWLSDLSFFPFVISQISVVVSLVVLLFWGIFQAVCLPYTCVGLIRSKLSKRIVYYIKTSLLIISMAVLLWCLFKGKDLTLKLSKQNATESEFHLPDILKHPHRGGDQTPEIADLELTTEPGTFEKVLNDVEQTPEVVPETPLERQEKPMEIIQENNTPIDSNSDNPAISLDNNKKETSRENSILQEQMFREFKQEILNLQDVQEIHIENILQRLESIELELMNLDSIKSEIGEIKQIIEKDRMKIDIVKKYGPNYALSSLGASVKSSKPIRSKSNNPDNILQGTVTAGKCFGIGPTNSFVEVQLAKQINVKAVIIRHLPTYSNESKPREVVIMGKSVLFEKDQEYLIQQVNTKADRVRIDIKNNWGKDYTCLYSVQVHGTE